MIQVVIQIVGWLLALALACEVLPLIAFLLFFRRLEREPAELPGDGTSEEGWPEITVVVPARDEGESLRQAMQTLLDLDYPKLRIVAVDDRSRDDTGKILDELAAGSERLAVVHVDELPSGWLGKNPPRHAGRPRRGPSDRRPRRRSASRSRPTERPSRPAPPRCCGRGNRSRG